MHDLDHKARLAEFLRSPAARRPKPATDRERVMHRLAAMIEASGSEEARCRAWGAAHVICAVLDQPAVLGSIFAALHRGLDDVEAHLVESRRVEDQRAAETIAEVGAVVAWDKVPDGALVRWRLEGAGDEYFWRRHAESAARVLTYDGQWRSLGSDNGRFSDGEPVSIVALGLSGHESEAEVRQLAEVFEVREALDELLVCPQCCCEEPAYAVLDDDALSQPWCRKCDREMCDPDLAQYAVQLHAEGWRRGMTAADAVRALSALVR